MVTQRQPRQIQQTDRCRNNTCAVIHAISSSLLAALVLSGGVALGRQLPIERDAGVAIGIVIATVIACFWIFSRTEEATNRNGFFNNTNRVNTIETQNTPAVTIV